MIQKLFFTTSKFKIILAGLFLLLIVPSMNVGFTQTSYLAVEQTEYEIKTSGEDMTFVKIYGEGEDGVENRKIAIIITLPDGTTDNHRIFSTSEGYFELLYPITKVSQEGQYTVFASFETKILNQVSFEVKKVHPFETIKTPTYVPSSSITPSTVFDKFYSNEFGLTVHYPSNWIIEESENKKLIIFADVMKVNSNRGAIAEINYDDVLGNVSTKNQIAKKLEEFVIDITSERLIEGTLNVIERKIIEVGDNTNYYFTTQLQVQSPNDSNKIYKSTQIHNILISKDKKMIFTTIEILPGDVSKVKSVADKIIESLVLDKVIQKQETIVSSPIITEKKEISIIEQTNPIEEKTIQNIPEKKKIETRAIAPEKEESSGAGGGIFLILIIIIISAIIIKLRKKKSKKERKVNFENQYIKNKPKTTPKHTTNAIPEQSKGSPITNTARIIQDESITFAKNIDKVKEVIPKASPIETTPIETTPIETTPIETTPIETTPIETTPIETTPIETTPIETISTNSLCKRKCREFVVKKIQGTGRYESGQVHCQTCDVWLDYKGCHKKDGSPAEEGTIGMRCDCCNVQVRSKPRSRIYKEKLLEKSSKKEEFQALNQNPCPKCGVTPTAENIESIFGMRVNEGKSIRQSHCRKCRNYHALLNENKVNRKEISQIDVLNFVNSKNMSNTQPYISVLNKFVKLANQFPNESITQIFETRHKIGINSENTTKNQRSIVTNFDEFLKFSNTNETKLNKNKKIDSIKSNEPTIPESKQDKEIKDMTYKMVAEHIHWKTNINKKLKIELIDSYIKHKSMKKVYSEFSMYPKLKIRLHLVTNMRLPSKLKAIESSGGLHSDPTCSITIALYAADYYGWDGDNNEEDIITLSKSISKYLQTDHNLNKTFEGRR